MNADLNVMTVCFMSCMKQCMLLMLISLTFLLQLGA